MIHRVGPRFDSRFRVTCARVGSALRRFAGDESGQDLIEYALLTATIGLASAAAWGALGPVVRDTYTSWNDNLYNLWESPDPS